ncbi:zinc finger BED domain-containing protein RICESLEEPER 1-like isoform X1 [Phoenix dactylifera]|uniref:Zinc finger BED domain-containing protein RICESLEEPER 1-like isoform X1 n=1 Tax=Phoenix dactylifera TaxID=42345 RepID=A0A8B7C6N6_PHODC|nr:zinc finger BED domain-containing protein RICESLEEPER 1-like isoform X1 [Phoenix dactylifera]
MAESTEMEGQGNTNATGSHNPRSRKLRSLVWNDFTKERKADGSFVAICNHCKKQLTASSRSGTTHLKNHLGTCTSSKRMKRKKLVVRRLVLKSSDAKNDGAPGLEHPQFDQELSRQDLARMIVLHGYPFSIVHHVGFRTFVRNLQPQFKLASCDMVKADCMKVYENARLRLQELLDKLLCRVTLMVDMWRSSEGLEYVCLTCHYVDDEWKLKKKILNFVPMEAPLTGEEISKTIVEKLHEWNIGKKLASIVLDNCSTSDVVTGELLKSLRPKGFLLLNGDLFRVHSCAHILNLVVQESLELAGEVTSKVRDSVQFVKSSQERATRFQKAAKQVGAPQKPLILDAPTSWVSTYSMLETACQYQDAFSRLAEWDTEFTDCLSSKEWSNAKAVAECLEVLYHAIEKFSATRVPTANLYFNDICGIHLLMKTWCMSPHPVVASMAVQMLEKFEQYWDLTRIIMAIASILDPRYKMKSIEYYFKLIYNDPYESKARIDTIRNNFINLYNEYAIQSANSSKNQAYLCYVGNASGYTSSESGNGGESKTSYRITLSDTRRGLDQYLQETSSSQPSKSDLDMYMEEAVHPSKEGLDDNFNILAWWKFNAAKYPILSIMARDILAIPMSIVPLDSEARTLNQYLSSMDPMTVQGIICAQDWLKDEIEAVGPVDGLALVSAAAGLEGDDECMIPANGDEFSPLSK